MSMLQHWLLYLCPVNVLRPSFLHSVPPEAHNALINIYNDALQSDPDGFRDAMLNTFSVDSTNAPLQLDFNKVLHLVPNYTSTLRWSPITWFYFNSHGCIWRTRSALYRALQKSFDGIDGSHLSTWTAILFTCLLGLTGLISSYRSSNNWSLQCAYSMAVLLVYNTMFVFSQVGLHLVIIATIHLLTLLVFNLGYRPKSTKSNKTPSFGSYVIRFRGLFMLATIIAILAYDNLYFNRRCSKTFFKGYSSMDIGCGFMIIHSGAMRSLSQSQERRTILSILRRNWTLLLLGVLRLISTWAVDYKVPVEEYGVHWNFFLALGLAKILSELVLNLVSPNFAIIAAFLIATLHECGLWFFDAVNSLPLIERVGILSANKEGIVAIPNSITLFLFGYCTVGFCARLYHKRGRGYAILYTAMTSICCALGSYSLCLLGLPSSRTLANCRFVLNTGAIFLGGFCTILLADVVFGGNADYTVLDSIGDQSFVFFLLANLMTGAVNLWCQPLLLPLVLMFPLLLLYGTICCTTAVLLQRHGLKLL